MTSKDFFRCDSTSNAGKQCRRNRGHEGPHADLFAQWGDDGKCVHKGPTWTRTPPAEPGYYWVASPEKGKPKVAYLTPERPGPITPNTVWWAIVGSDTREADELLWWPVAITPPAVGPEDKEAPK